MGDQDGTTGELDPNQINVVANGLNHDDSAEKSKNDEHYSH